MRRNEGAVQSIAHGYNGFDFSSIPQLEPPSPSPSSFNPDDILPSSFGIHNRAFTPSPTRGNQTPSPAATPPGLGRPITNGYSMQNSYVNFSRTSPQTHHRISTALSDIEEVDTTPKGSRYPEFQPATLASSPTIRENGAMGLVDWKAHSRKLSDGSSSSVHSEELANMKWPGFDSAHGADVESVVLEEEEDSYGTLPKVADSDDISVLDDTWLGPRSDEDDDEDLLSKRADMILANAKKRLNVRLQSRSIMSLSLTLYQGTRRKPSRRTPFFAGHAISAKDTSLHHRACQFLTRSNQLRSKIPKTVFHFTKLTKLGTFSYAE